MRQVMAAGVWRPTKLVPAPQRRMEGGPCLGSELLLSLIISLAWPPASELASASASKALCQVHFSLSDIRGRSGSSGRVCLCTSLATLGSLGGQAHA